MNKETLIQNTITFVKETLVGAEGGHDWFHVERVYKLAMRIAKQEEVDQLVVSLGALLHDIADSKFHEGDETVGPKLAKDFLEKEQAPQTTISHVVKIIENISFKGGNEAQVFRSPELDVVQDADRLDAIGAIGIARTFNYGGHKNRPLYDPELKPDLQMTKEQYKASISPTINHFYEKLLLLKDRMNTQAGQKIATNRHEYMKDFLNRFYEEWDGKL